MKQAPVRDRSNARATVRSVTMPYLRAGSEMDSGFAEKRSYNTLNNEELRKGLDFAKLTELEAQRCFA